LTVSLVGATIIATSLVLFFLIQSTPLGQGDQLSAYIGQPVSPAVMQQLTGVSGQVLSTIGSPSSVLPPAAVATSSGGALLQDGRPEVLYIGGEFCPYCAEERWSLVIALSHFGTFSGLEYMQSSSADVNPDTPTFTFANATYSSQYVTFIAVEELNRQGQTIASLTSGESALFTQYGTCAMTGSSGGIPFVDIANAYVVNCGAQFSLPQIAGDNWTQVASQLGDPSTLIAQDIDGASNTLTTAICKVDGGQPTSVCGQAFADVTLGYARAAGGSAPPVGSGQSPVVALQSFTSPRPSSGGRRPSLG
jgi:Domain of unknown function (DUF929)